MLHTIMRYKSDRPVEVLLMFGREFEKLVPDRYIRINDEPPIPVEDVVCDLCNKGIGPMDPCALRGMSSLHCWECFQKHDVQYCSLEALAGSKR